MPVTDLTSAVIRLCTLIVSLTSLGTSAVLRSYGDMPRPSASHMLVQVLDDQGVGLPSTSGTTVTHARRAPVLITAYGDEAVTELGKLSSLLWSDSGDMHAAVGDGLSIEAMSGVSDETAVKTSSYEPRASVTVTIGFVRSLTTTAPTEADSVVVEVNSTPDVIEVP